MKSNPILKTLKEGDIVLIEIGSQIRLPIKQICKIYNLNFQPADEKFSFDWLEFDGDILYTNYKLHPSMLKKPAGNCMAIIEVIPRRLLPQYTKVNMMWKPEDYPMSNEELEYMEQKMEI